MYSVWTMGMLIVLSVWCGTFISGSLQQSLITTAKWRNSARAHGSVYRCCNYSLIVSTFACVSKIKIFLYMLRFVLGVS